MSIQWDKLREFDGSVWNAFEELCAQIARIESSSRGWDFVRNGKPDGGLECYATTPSGSLVGWQAKWFPTSPTAQQWDDIEASFNDAFANYPALGTFVVCLPLDRGNARGKRKLAMDKWNAATTRWAGYAKSQGRNISFEFRGTSELFEVLSRRDQAGRLRFWFQHESLNAEWFRKQFMESWANNRRRYRPELHVSLRSDEWSHALCQTGGYVDQLKESASNVALAIRALGRWSKVAPIKDSLAIYVQAGHELERLLLDLPKAAESNLPFEQLRAVWQKIRDEWQKPTSAAPLDSKGTVNHDLERALYQLDDAARELYEFTEEDWSRVNMARAILLLGDAGQGKTHALFRLADERTSQGCPVVILAGINFSKGDPWKQMIGSLGLNCDRDEFLGALNAAGEAKQTRALIIIDALNESDDPSIWKRSLAGMLQTMHGVPFVALAVSMRGEYAETVIPDGLSDEELPQVMHRGFAGREADAVVKIFEEYGVRAPEVPLLAPEFANPLFVITLAEGLKNADLDTLPPAAQSLLWVFDLWLDGVNKKLALPSELDYDVNDPRLQDASLALAQAMADRGSKWLPVADAKSIVGDVEARRPWSKSMLRGMLSEDVVQRLHVYDFTARKVAEGIRFTFDRFADHHIVRAILSRYNNPTELKSACAQINGYPEQVNGLRFDAGLLRALAIELPEDPRYRCELRDVLTDSDVDGRVLRAILESIQWRSVESITPAVVDLVRNEWMNQRTGSMVSQRFSIELLVQMSMRAGHPLNADFVDAELRAEPMRERDYWWSRPLTALGEPDGIVMRLIDWFHTSKSRQVDDETARLASVILFWLFATSNRFIRDRATKASVAVLTRRPRLASVLVERFLAVDDTYVVERVLATAYGVALRTTDQPGLKELATNVYTRCFRDGQLPVHLPARSYAHGIVDAAARRHLVPKAWASRAKPPYKSSWPTTISVKGDWEHIRDGDWDNDRGLRAVWRSVFEDDFSHYVIGHGHHEWLRFRLKDSLPAELTSSDNLRNTAEDWAVVEADRDRAKADGQLEYPPPVYALPHGSLPPRSAPSGRPLTPSEIEAMAWFPSEQTRCMVMDEVVRLGYTSKLDEGVQSAGRNGEHVGRFGTKSERVGKKYQWIAYWTAQAQIADKFRFAGSHNIPLNGRYEGSWQISRARDIDPTCLLRRVAGDDWNDSPTWWAPFIHTEFERPCDDYTWLTDTSRVPKLQDICAIVEPCNRRSWTLGWTFVRLKRQKPKGVVTDEWRRRSVWYCVETVFVHNRDASRLARWLNRERQAVGANGYRLLPERPHLDECYLREFPDSAAWTAEDTPFYRRDGWNGNRWGGAPVKLSLVADGYFEDGERDASRDEVLQFALPSAELFRELGLQHADQDGHFVTPDGRLAAWDPSVTQKGPMALLIDSALITDFARRKGYRLVTFVYGEQLVMNEGYRSDDYLGRLLFSGVFTHEGTQWAGSADARFDPPPCLPVTAKSKHTPRNRSSSVVDAKAQMVLNTEPTPASSKVKTERDQQSTKGRGPRKRQSPK